MKCPNCGFEIEKPNVRTCPCCGQKITQMEHVPDEPLTSESTTSAPSPQTEEDSNQNAISQEPSVWQPTPEPEKVVCSMCHNKVPKDSDFCPICGYDLIPAIDKKQKRNSGIPQQPLSGNAETTQNYYAQESESDNNAANVQETPVPSRRIDNYRKEDNDEYFDNGTYIPDSDEPGEELEEPEPIQETSSASQIIIPILTAILSIALGVALYYVINK